MFGDAVRNGAGVNRDSGPGVGPVEQRGQRLSALTNFALRVGETQDGAVHRGLLRSVSVERDFDVDAPLEGALDGSLAHRRFLGTVIEDDRNRPEQAADRKSTRLNSSHTVISYAV